MAEINGDRSDDRAQLDLSGTGRHFAWLNLPGLLSLVASAFLLSFSVRRVGPVQYGAVVTIGAMIAILTLFTTAIRYAVVRSGARHDASTSGSGQAEADAIKAAHSMFVGTAIAMVVIACGLGWLIPVDLHLHGPLAVQAYVSTILFVAASSATVAVMAYTGVLTAKEQFGLVARITILGLSVQIVATVLLVDRLKLVGLGLAALVAGIVQAFSTYVVGRRRVLWLRLVPSIPRKLVAIPVLRYAAGLVVLSATATLCAASDSFVIGAVTGSKAVTVFRIGSVAPTSLVTLVYSAFAALFPRLARTPDAAAQEEAVGWVGRVTGWMTGWIFACLCLVSSDIVRLLFGHSDSQATHVLWICSGALMVDAAYHGVVQVIFARGNQGFLAKYSCIELIFNLLATFVFVELVGPVGSAWALAATIVVTDVISFPMIMRGRWGSPAGRFVVRHGVVQSVVAAGLTIAIGIGPILETHGLAVHLALLVAVSIAVLAAGAASIGARGRTRLRRLVQASAG